MVATDSLLSGFMAGGIAGVGAAALSKQASSFKNVATKKVADDPTTTTDSDSGSSTWDVVSGIILIVTIILSIIFLVAIYRMMPNYKVLHVIMTILIGPLWYMPAFIYYCVTNDYVLMPSTGGYTGANNTRGRSSNKYL